MDGNNTSVNEMTSVAIGKAPIDGAPRGPNTSSCGTEHDGESVPIFKGEEVKSWIVHAELYLADNEIAPVDRVSLVRPYFDGAARAWLHFRELIRPFESWEDLRDGIIRRFGRPPLEELMNLRQTGSVGEYRSHFECLAASAQVKDTAMLNTLFVGGLKQEIRSLLLSYLPRPLEDLINLALSIESCVEAAVEEQKKTRKKLMKLNVKYKKENKGLWEKVLEMEKQLDKSRLEVSETVKLLREKEDELEYLEELKETLVVQERQRNEELQDARKELVNGLEGMPMKGCIGLKRIGEVDSRPFHEAMKRKYNTVEAYEKSSMELWLLWQQYVNDPQWHPLKVVNTDGKHQIVIDQNDEKLRYWKRDYGEKVYNAVTTALLEINEYNPNVGYAISELWNYHQSRRATLKEGVEFLLKQWKSCKQKRRLMDSP